MNDDKRLILTAFDGYFGFRPLLDQVEVWVIDEAYSSMVYPSLSKPQMNKQASTDEVELDPGCTFLLLNKTLASQKTHVGPNFKPNTK